LSHVQGGEAELDVPEPVHHAEAGNPPYHEVRSYFGLHLKGWFREIFKLFLRFFKFVFEALLLQTGEGPGGEQSKGRVSRHVDRGTIIFKDA
jgi:hypothetical protein